MVEAKQKKSTIHQEQINIIEEKPVLDKIETLVHKDVIEQAHVHEVIKQREIEIHEKPIEKQVLHPEKEIFVKEADEFEVFGREKALSERNKLIKDLREADVGHEIKMEERSDVRVIEQAPSVTVDHELTREIIERPIVTEVHHQPVKEVHERDIHKTIYETPIVKVVREETVKEVITVSSPVPLSTNIATTTIKEHKLL